MTKRCAVLDDYQDVATTYADWAPADVELTVITEHLDEDATAEALQGKEIVVLMRERTPFPRTLIERLPELELLVTSGLRNASIDLAAARDQGVTVCGTGGSSQPPAELTWALILGLARDLTLENANLRTDGPWQSSVGTDLHGATLGLVGLGKIGAQMAQVGQAFGMEVVAWSPHLTDERAAAAGVRRAESLHLLLAGADFVSLHLVLSETTRNLLGVAELAAMKPSAYLVNTSRAGLVDTAALVDALEAGRIRGAGLDVFDVEPLPPADRLRTLPNVLATPHLGYVTDRNYRGFFTGAVEDIVAFRAGAPIRTL